MSLLFYMTFIENVVLTPHYFVIMLKQTAEVSQNFKTVALQCLRRSVAGFSQQKIVCRARLIAFGIRVTAKENW